MLVVLGGDLICVIMHHMWSHTDILVEDGEIKADEIWDVYKNASRIPQVRLS